MAVLVGAGALAGCSAAANHETSAEYLDFSAAVSSIDSCLQSMRDYHVATSDCVTANKHLVDAKTHADVANWLSSATQSDRTGLRSDIEKTKADWNDYMSKICGPHWITLGTLDGCIKPTETGTKTVQDDLHTLQGILEALSKDSSGG